MIQDWLCFCKKAPGLQTQPSAEQQCAAEAVLCRQWSTPSGRLFYRSYIRHIYIVWFWTQELSSCANARCPCRRNVSAWGFSRKSICRSIKSKERVVVVVGVRGDGGVWFQLSQTTNDDFLKTFFYHQPWSWCRLYLSLTIARLPRKEYQRCRPRSRSMFAPGSSNIDVVLSGDSVPLSDLENGWANLSPLEQLNISGQHKMFITGADASPRAFVFGPRDNSGRLYDDPHPPRLIPVRSPWTFSCGNTAVNCWD